MPVSKLLNLPIGSYLMVRLDYVIICGNNELEAKVLRLIEMYMDDERRRLYQAQLNDPKNELTPDMVVEITRDVWVPISHRLFMNDLYGTVKSENTLKQAIKSLLDKKYIRISDPPTKQYEAPKYQINIEVVQGELNKLAKLGKAGYQKLIPSNSDTIKNSPHQNLTPSGYQELTPSEESRVSKIDTNSIKDYGNKKDTVEESSTVSTETDAPAFYSSQEIPVTYNQALAYLMPHGPHEGLDAAEVVKLAQKLWTEAHEESETDSHSHAGYTKLPSRPTPIPFAEQAKAISEKRQTDPALPVVKPSKQTPTSQSQVGSAPDGAPPASGGGTAQVGAGTKKKVTQAKQPEPEISSEAMAVIDQWSIAMKKTYPLTDNLIKAASILAPCNPSVEDLKAVRLFCFKSNPKWFRDERKGAVTLMDIAKNWEAWQSSQEVPPDQQSGKPATNSKGLRVFSNGLTEFDFNDIGRRPSA